MSSSGSNSSASSSSAGSIDPRVQELLDQLDNLLDQVLNVHVNDNEAMPPETCNRLRSLESEVDNVRARLQQLVDIKDRETADAIKKLLKKP